MKLLIVDDSALIRGIMKDLFSVRKEIQVVGEATNGLAGAEMNLTLFPDVIVMDINMPVLNGLDATRKIMKERPVPIIIFSSAVDAAVSFEAVSLGAFDVIRKPDIDKLNDSAFLASFFGVLTAAGNKSLQGFNGTRRAPESLPPAGSLSSGASFKGIVLGASTGGPVAVREVLKDLPASFPLGIALVQHLEEGFDEGYAKWLDESTALKVKLAGPTPEVFKPGTVIVAPVNKHLVVAEGKLALDDGPKVLNQKPAVDVLFGSAADWYGGRILGVLLTGMGKDGAAGCKKILDKGGFTLVQDQATSAIFGMPKAAIEAGGASEVLPLREIPTRLLAITSRMEGNGR